MTISKDNQRKLPRLLDDVSRAVEDLLLTGLTTASQATRQTLDVSFREVSRMRLLRLGSTLRAANEELGRFTAKEPNFSKKRLTFFLNRAWMLCRGLSRALRDDNQEEFDRLLWIPATQPVKKLEVVTLGVAKNEIKGAYCAFEFRLRTIAKVGKAIPKGHRLTWSCIFPMKPGTEIPAEGFLHLPQKQKFKASDFLKGNVLVIASAGVALDGFGGGRITLGNDSTVEAGDAFDDWPALQTWDREAAVKRIAEHETSPFDLDVEMQEEVILTDWTMEPESDQDRDGQHVYPLSADDLALDAVVAKSSEGAALKKSFGAYQKKKKKPPLFGLMHYELCRLIFQPLTVFDPDPVHLMISNEKIDRAALLKSLNF